MHHSQNGSALCAGCRDAGRRAGRRGRSVVKLEDVKREFVPKALPVGRLEVERIDVLILLGGILRVLDGAIGTMDEPLGVLLNPRMIGRTLEGDVEGDLHPIFASGGDQVIEVCEGAKFGVDRFVTAVGRTQMAQWDCLRRRRGLVDAVLLGPLRKARPMG